MLRTGLSIEVPYPQIHTMATARTRLTDFLKDYRSSKGGAFTHTSILGPSGSYYIPPRNTADFIALYKDAVRKGETELYLTEKHIDVGPILIDLDFRFSGTDLARKYTDAIVLDVTKTYTKTLLEFFDVPHVDVYVLEKPSPVMAKTLVKDGFHIVVPDIVTTPMFQYMLRETAMPELKRILAPLELHNKLSDVVDEAVIEKNNWQMIGSRKPSCAAYAITKIIRCFADSDQEEYLPIDKPPEEYVELLSIRNKVEPTAFKPEKAQEFKAYEDRIQETKLRQHFKSTILSKTKNAGTNSAASEEDYAQAKALASLLNAERAESYNDWIRVGWCLHNIDHRLQEDWIAFSRQSNKFKDGGCERLWDHMRQDGGCLGMGTLHVWAKNDNPAGYAKLISEDLRALIRESSNGTEYDVARVIVRKYAHRFAYDGANRRWYHFTNHRWRVTPDGMALKNKLPTDVATEYRNSSVHYSTQANLVEDVAERNTLDDLVTRLQSIVLKLKKASFQTNIMTQCAMLFIDEHFEEKLDSNLSLIGFENGVFDLDANEFRAGRPEDYISLTTNINFVPLSEQPAEMIDEVNNFISQVLPDRSVKEYVLRLFASFLHGAIREERFHVWTGIGSNGKSKIIELYQNAFGAYCCSLPVALLTQKRGASGSATPELARARSKRFAVLQEPSDDTINCGLLKELTGGDKIYARALYSAGYEFKPQFKLVLTCNHLPVVPSDDGGTWRRIRVVPFKSKFCDNPNPENENEFLIDTELSSKFEDWAPIFMSLLVNKYKSIVGTKYREPDVVLEATREYQRRNDLVADFVDSCITKGADESVVLLDQAYSDFKSWLREEGITERGTSMRKNDFLSLLEKQMGKCCIMRKTKGWKGFTLKSAMTADANTAEADGV
jgi:P4 family phage/plasmid primase-like protien